MSVETNCFLFMLTIDAKLAVKFTASVPGHFQNALTETGGKCQALASLHHISTKFSMCQLPEFKRTCQDRYSKSKQNCSEVEKPQLTPNTSRWLVVL